MGEREAVRLLVGLLDGKLTSSGDRFRVLGPLSRLSTKTIPPWTLEGFRPLAIVKTRTSFVLTPLPLVLHIYTPMLR